MMASMCASDAVVAGGGRNHGPCVSRVSRGGHHSRRGGHAVETVPETDHC